MNAKRALFNVTLPNVNRTKKTNIFYDLKDDTPRLTLIWDIVRNSPDRCFNVAECFTDAVIEELLKILMGQAKKPDYLTDFASLDKGVLALNTLKGAVILHNCEGYPSNKIAVRNSAKDATVKSQTFTN